MRLLPEMKRCPLWRTEMELKDPPRASSVGGVSVSAKESMGRENSPCRPSTSATRYKFLLSLLHVTECGLRSQSLLACGEARKWTTQLGRRMSGITNMSRRSDS